MMLNKIKETLVLYYGQMNYHVNYAETIKNFYNAWLFPLISSQEDNRNADDIPSMNCRNSMSRTHSW